MAGGTGKERACERHPGFWPRGLRILLPDPSRLAALAGRLDFKKIFRFARHLDAYDLKAVAAILRGEKDLDTDGYIETLRSFGLTSNVNLGEVQRVDLGGNRPEGRGRRGPEPRNQHHPAAGADRTREQLGLKLKRGVLLAGPRHGQDDCRTSFGPSFEEQILSDRRHLHRRDRQTSIIRSIPFFRKPSTMPLRDFLLRRCDLRGRRRDGPLPLPADHARRSRERKFCASLRDDDGDGRRQFAPMLIRSGRIELWLASRWPDFAARAAILEQLLRIAKGNLRAADRVVWRKRRRSLPGPTSNVSSRTARTCWLPTRSSSPAASGDGLLPGSRRNGACQQASLRGSRGPGFASAGGSPSAE